MKKVILTESQFSLLKELILEEENIESGCLHIEDIYDTEEFKEMCSRYNIPNNKKLVMATQTNDFKKWFGGSVAVNSMDLPRVFYHQTDSSPFQDFMKSKIGSNFGTALGNGYYFSDVRYEGGGYGNNELRAFLKLENPYYAKLPITYLLPNISELMGFDCSKDPYIIEKSNEQRGLVDICGYYKRNLMEELGFDSVIWESEYMVFNPNQIMMIDWGESIKI